MIRINLLPIREFKKKRALRLQVWIYVVVVACSLVGMAAAYGFFYLQLNVLEVEKKNKEDARIEAQARVDEFRKLTEELKDLNERIETINKLEPKRRGPVRVLEEISRRLPPDRAWLTSLDEAKNPKGQDTLSLKGLAVDNETIAMLLSNLANPTKGAAAEAAEFGLIKVYNIFKDVELVRSAQEVAKDLRLKSFAMTCVIVLPEEHANVEAKTAAERTAMAAKQANDAKTAADKALEEARVAAAANSIVAAKGAATRAAQAAKTAAERAALAEKAATEAQGAAKWKATPESRNAAEKASNDAKGAVGAKMAAATAATQAKSIADSVGK